MRVEASGIKETIKHLEKVKKNLGDEKMLSALKKLVNEGYQVARAGFDSALYAGLNDVKVNIVWESNSVVSLVASGKSVLFIEFGSGVTFPESPYSVNFPEVVPHGEYGHKQGGNPKGWIYEGERGNGGLAMDVVEHRKNGKDVVRPGRYRTWGNPPARAMYEASKEMHKRVEEILKEVMS